jgi:hypothetical protein
MGAEVATCARVGVAEGFAHIMIARPKNGRTSVRGGSPPI